MPDASPRTLSWLLQDCSHQNPAEGLGILGAERSKGSHEVARGGLAEGQDLGTEKAGDGNGSKGSGVQETSATLTLTRLRKSCSAKMAALV